MVIVIDPGHGGENEGTIEHLKGRVEKEMTLKTSESLYNELKEYEGAEVYITRTVDTDLSLAERADFAASVSADFLFSVHYNASVRHDLYGAEIWIPSEAPYSQEAMDFAVPWLHAMDEEGIFIRGAKTKLNSRGSNYYGIIRESTLREIPCVILEHCHVDHENDVGFCDSDDELQRFGEIDARCIAGFLGLKKDGETPEINAEPSFEASHAFDPHTPPDYCRINLMDQTDLSASVSVHAGDFDTPLMFYDYSTDGGLTFSEKYEVPGYDYFTGQYDNDFSCDVELVQGRASNVVFRVFNVFDDFTESNHLLFAPTTPPEDEPVKIEEPEETEEIRITEVKEEAPITSGKGEEMTKAAIIVAAFLAAVMITALLLRLLKK